MNYRRDQPLQAQNIPPAASQNKKKKKSKHKAYTLIALCMEIADSNSTNPKHVPCCCNTNGVNRKKPNKRLKCETNRKI